MSSSVTKKILTGRLPSLLRSKRNSTISSKRLGEYFQVNRLVRTKQAPGRFWRYTKALDNIKALRKDRVGDLKTEKERLEGLAKEKGHADKLRARISELKNTIHVKEITYEETKRDYDEVVVANAKYYEYASRFREIYIKIENLQEKQKTLQADLDETRVNVPEILGVYSFE